MHARDLTCIRAPLPFIPTEPHPSRRLRLGDGTHTSLVGHVLKSDRGWVLGSVHERAHVTRGEGPHDLHVLVCLVRRDAGWNPVPGLPSGMSWVRVWVGPGIPATQDTKRNSSDECARDPRRSSHDLRQTHLASRFRSSDVTKGGTLTQFQLCLDVTADTALSEGPNNCLPERPPPWRDAPTGAPACWGGVVSARDRGSLLKTPGP